ncbi:MAG: protein kinase [Gemmatimonadetes bacterium]|nr:protein kinase [Gemmatimonadota bacterium]
MTEMSARLTTALAHRYRIERHLGEGGMANVYLAEDVKHHRKVAVKVLRPELAAVLGAERFLKEIEVTANLQHPHILPLFDSGEADGFLYYVMPFIDGETVRDKLNREKQLGVEETVKIAESVAAALQYAHERGVVHRDIKPENILLQSGHALVADFGIALAVSQAVGTRLTRSGLSLGTPDYMSPEQATADREMDGRSDIYSLGAMVYEMLVGDPPHIASTAQAVIAKIINDEPEPVTKYRHSVPVNVADAVRKAVEKTPADRFATAAQFADALTNPDFRLPMRLGGASVTGPGAGWSWNRLTVAFAALAAVFLVTTLRSGLGSEPPTPVVRYGIGLDQELEGAGGAFGTSVALSPDGSQFVYVGPTADGLGFQLWLRQRDQLEGFPLAGTEGGYQPFFSPDGQSVGFLVLQSRQLKAVSLGGEPPVTLVDSGLFRLGGTWGPDGYLYFSQRPNGGLSRIPAIGGVSEAVSMPDFAAGETRHAWPASLPSGKGILITVQRGNNALSAEDDVAVVDLATGEHRVLVRGLLGRYATTGHLLYVRHDGALMAAPFDQERLVLTGAAVQLLGGIGVRRGPDVALSHTGRLVYATGDTLALNSEVVWVERDGSASAIEPGFEITPHGGTGPALSPDGTRVAVSVVGSEGVNIWIKELDGGSFQRLTFGGDFNVRPVWSADNRWVMFLSNQARAALELFRRRADGSGPAERVLDWRRPPAEGLWSRDGQWLVVRTDGARDIFALRPGVDSVPQPLLTMVFDETAPALSPDGRWMAYVSDESGRSEVYVRSFPNVEDTQRQVSTDGGMEPVWAHSGRELFYKNASRDLVAVTVRTNPTFAVVGRRELFTLPTGASATAQHAQYGITRDDTRFIMFRTPGTAEGVVTERWIVVENFFEELKAKVGN